MEAILFILALIVLFITLSNFFDRPTFHQGDDRSDYLKSAANKLRGHADPRKNDWKRLFQSESERRRDYYRNEYLKSEAWKRKRYVVLRRDNWRCVYCGGRATQVHHKKYARKNIGKEPIDWLVSVCKPCHDSIHR